MNATLDYAALHARAVAVLKLGENYTSRQIADALGVSSGRITQWWVAVDGITECARVKNSKGGAPLKIFRAHDVREFLARKAGRQRKW